MVKKFSIKPALTLLFVRFFPFNGRRGFSAIVTLSFAIALSSCKPPVTQTDTDSAGSDTEDILKAKRWSWKQFDNVDLFLYSFSPRITRGSSSAWTGKRCWYYKEAPRKKNISTSEALSTAIRLNNKSLADVHLKKSYANSIFWNTIEAGVATQGAAAACSEAMIGTGVMLAMPALAAGAAAGTAWAIFGCAGAVTGFVDSNRRIGRNLEAMRGTANANIDSKLAFTPLDVDAIGRIKTAVFDNTHNHNGDVCPRSNEIMQHLR
jgi:hypothetical protein